MTSETYSPPARNWRRLLISALILALVGAVLGYAFGRFVMVPLFPTKEDLPDLRWSDLLVVMTGTILLVTSLYTLFAGLSAARLGRLLRLEGPATPDEMRQTRLQSVVLVGSAVLLVLPLVFRATGLAPTAALAVIAGLLVVHTLMNLRAYRESDELIRRITLEASALTFWLGQGVLFVWAAAERLGAAPPLTAWDIYAVLMALYLVASVTVTVRRGLG